jgi:S1/P1 Nuclease
MIASVSLCRVTGLLVAMTLLCTVPSGAYAWGEKGHRIIGHMARVLLSPATQRAIRQLMGSDDLATFALYLDLHKDQLDQQIPGSRDWHYDDVPICTAKPYAEYCPQGACASTQLPRHYRRLMDAHESRNRKQFAVFVLTHLMGDIHQPLHAADNDDTGGNQLKVHLPDGRQMNLHAVWDTALVERLFGGQNETTVARRLVQKYATRATQWQAGKIDLAKIQAWMSESTQLAKTVAYGKLPGFTCGADMEQTRIALSEDYLRQTGVVVEEQLAKAGYRLAAALNRAFGG